MHGMVSHNGSDLNEQIPLFHLEGGGTDQQEVPGQNDAGPHSHFRMARF